MEGAERDGPGASVRRQECFFTRTSHEMHKDPTASFLAGWGWTWGEIQRGTGLPLALYYRPGALGFGKKGRSGLGDCVLGRDYFDSKDAILRGLIEREVAPVARNLRAVAEAGMDDPAGALQRVAAAFTALVNDKRKL